MCNHSQLSQQLFAYNFSQVLNKRGGIIVALRFAPLNFKYSYKYPSRCELKQQHRDTVERFKVCYSILEFLSHFQSEHESLSSVISLCKVSLYLLVGNNLNELNPSSMSDTGRVVTFKVVVFGVFIAVLAVVLFKKRAICQMFKKVRTSNGSSTIIITGDFMAVLSLLMVLLFGGRQEKEKGTQDIQQLQKPLSKYTVKSAAPQETVVLHSQPHSAQLHIYPSGFTADHKL